MVNVAILSATAWEMMHKMAEVKWIKLSVALPDNKKIKQIRKLPDGDTIALMWVFLLCLAGDVNDDGAVYFTPEIPYTDEMLAGQFDMDINTVRLALKTFQHFGMIEIIDDIIHLTLGKSGSQRKAFRKFGSKTGCASKNSANAKSCFLPQKKVT